MKFRKKPLPQEFVTHRLKVDISKTELLVFEPVTNTSFEEYSDLEPFELNCYSLEEVLVEKMRAVMQRMQARDYYDIWYLLVVHGMDADYYKTEFAEKCNHKKLNSADFFTKLDQRLPQYKARWISSMNEQIKNLPDFEKIDRETQRKLKNLKK